MTALTPITLTPDQIRIEANIRREVKVDKPFWSSIKQDGVLIPIVVELVDGAYRVIDGQRRTLAAVDGGVTEIPAFVVDGIRSDADRVIRQLVVNDHREPITDADRLAAWQTLFDLDVSADAIARKTKTPKARVETALKVTQSSVAAAAIQEHHLTLDQAAAIAEFDDEPERASALAAVAATNPGRLQHEVAAAREARDAAKAIAEKRAELEAQGLRVLEEVPSYDHPTIGRTRELYADAQKAKQWSSLDRGDEHATCPGRVFAIYTSWRWNGDQRTVEAVAAEYCEDWKTHGHVKSGGSSGAGELTDEEKAKRKQARENNKLWSTATTVRLQFVKELLAEKEPPAGWELFVAGFLARGGVEDYRIRAFTEQLLEIHSDRQTWLAKNPTRAAQMCLAHAIAAIEGQYEYAKKGWSLSLTPEYLKWLAGWGYPLSELEETIKNTKSAAQ